MTSTTIPNQINQFVTNINQIMISTLSTSAAKAFYIDLPIYLLSSPSVIEAFGKTAIAATTYEIRSQVKNLFNYFEFNEYIHFQFNEYIFDATESQVNGTFISGATAGLIGGAFRYYVTGQNPVIGALNNAAYETCNNIDLCANNKFVNIAVTIGIEALDATAQTLLKASTGNTIGAAYSTIKGGMSIVEKLNTVSKLLENGAASNPIPVKDVVEILSKAVNDNGASITTELLDDIILKIPTDNIMNLVYKEFQNGATVGVLIASTVYGAYVPALDLQDPEYNVINNSLDALGKSLIELDSFHQEL